jgi:hypothetical protein
METGDIVACPNQPILSENRKSAGTISTPPPGAVIAALPSDSLVILAVGPGMPKDINFSNYCQMALSLLSRITRRNAVLALQQIDTTVPAFRPEPITQDEAAAMFRAVHSLFGKWEVTDEQAATLLDMPVRSYRRWKAEGPGRISRDGRARLSNLIGIHKALRLIFAEATLGYAWIKAANDAFAGASALNVMLGGELTDIMRVRRYLDAERGGW